MHLSNSALTASHDLVTPYRLIPNSLVFGSKWWNFIAVMHLWYPQITHFPPLYSIAFNFMRRRNCLTCSGLAALLGLRLSQSLTPHNLEQKILSLLLASKSLPQNLHCLIIESILMNSIIWLLNSVTKNWYPQEESNPCLIVRSDVRSPLHHGGISNSFNLGTPDRIRTCDHPGRNRTLCPLSYRGLIWKSRSDFNRRPSPSEGVALYGLSYGTIYRGE